MGNTKRYERQANILKDYMYKNLLTPKILADKLYPDYASNTIDRILQGRDKASARFLTTLRERNLFSKDQIDHLMIEYGYTTRLPKEEEPLVPLLLEERRNQLTAVLIPATIIAGLGTAASLYIFPFGLFWISPCCFVPALGLSTWTYYWGRKLGHTNIKRMSVLVVGITLIPYVYFIIVLLYIKVMVSMRHAFPYLPLPRVPTATPFS